MKETPMTVPSPDDAHGQQRAASVSGSIADPSDSKGGRDRGRRILVVSTVENAGDTLGLYTTPEDTIKIVVPAVRQSFLDWLANDQKAFAHAEEVAAETAATLPGHAVDATAGEADVALAIRDALATFAADEIIVAVRDEGDEGAVEAMATKGAPHRSAEGVPVRFIAISEE